MLSRKFSALVFLFLITISFSQASALTLFGNADEGIDLYPGSDGGNSITVVAPGLGHNKNMIMLVSFRALRGGVAMPRIPGAIRYVGRHECRLIFQPNDGIVTAHFDNLASYVYNHCDIEYGTPFKVQFFMKGTVPAPANRFSKGIIVN